MADWHDVKLTTHEMNQAVAIFRQVKSGHIREARVYKSGDTVGIIRLEIVRDGAAEKTVLAYKRSTDVD